MIFEITAYVTLTLLITLILFQSIYVWLYRRWLLSPTPSNFATEPVTGPCAVILCLRGADPSLEACLAQLSKQTYRNYQVFCVVDSIDDPSNALVDRWVRKDSRFQKLVRPESVNNSSLKCASIVYAIESLDDSIEFVVLIDADMIPHEQWLVQMLEPFGDKSVGATNGNRWFEPVDGTIGSWVRYLWNAAAVVQMYLYSIAWGGSLALRRKAIEGTKLIERWSRSLCEDTMVGQHMLHNGWKLVPVPRLMMVNREEISVRNAINWTYRQLLFARLYHWRWWLVAGHGVLLFGSSWLALATFIVGLFVADSLLIPAAIGLLALANYVLCGVGLILVLEKTVRETVSHRENFDWSFFSSAPKLFLAGTLLFFVQPLGTLWASVTKKLVWRNVTYRIKNPFDIEIVSIDSAPGNDGKSI